MSLFFCTPVSRICQTNVLSRSYSTFPRSALFKHNILKRREDTRNTVLERIRILKRLNEEKEKQKEKRREELEKKEERQKARQLAKLQAKQKTKLKGKQKGIRKDELKDTKSNNRLLSRGKPKNDSGKASPSLSYFYKYNERMKELFPSGWNPPRKLSREAMDGLRTLHVHDPNTFTTPVLAERFRISPEAVRRILKSKWTPNRLEKAKILIKERRRKMEAIERRIERERAVKWERIDRPREEEEERRRWKGKRDRLTLV